MSTLGRPRESVGGRRNSVSGASTPTSSGSTSVQVAVRIRPLTSADQSSIPTRWQRNVVLPISTNTLQVEQGSAPPPGAGAAPTAGMSNRDKKQTFSFDRVLSPSDGQAQVYAVAEPLIGRFLEGYNVTILAYGQTSSGKSYTMGTAAGDDVDYESLVAGRAPDPQMGIIPRAVAQIFGAIKQNQARSGATQYSAKASFIEIYNEDLIDLLGEAEGDARPHVQIREDRSGQIIWSGLREAKVSNVADVMNHLLRGSSVRRTNETDMNAQSSRSHAIFSLTLIQRKYIGSGPAPGPNPSTLSHPPSSYGGRASSTGLPRPSSSIPTPAFNRVSTPVGGSRPQTPGSSGIPGLSGRQSVAGLRPASGLGNARSNSPMFGGSGGDENHPGKNGGGGGSDGEWVTVTSKFHFVDLAGSERLKRTAAQGERVKEGISINSGLHALGNVISALGDPAKAKRTTHIPYRDSKLTRLLQDSLGGNAHTLMIACVSPTEYNVSETINTLQYANRARNIKNKAELNEVEVGWDDVDYLQTQVLKLRKEMGLLKGAANGSADLSGLVGGGREEATARAAQKEVLEWQDKYAGLSQKHSQLTAELTKLQQQQLGSKSKDNTDFLEAAEPIIVEYEKAVDTLEGQINLMKAALAHSEDIILENEETMEQQRASLVVVERELDEKETTITDLQARLQKVQEREATSDSYVQELEARLQVLTSKGEAESLVSSELRKEVARLKEIEANTEQYIKDLELRLSKADSSTAGLAATISQLEADAERREEEYKSLLSRFELLDSGEETNALVREINTKDQRLDELEQKLRDALQERAEASHRQAALQQDVDHHAKEKAELKDKLKGLEAAAAAAAALSATTGSGEAKTRALANGTSLQHDEMVEAQNVTSTEETDAVLSLRSQVECLQAELDGVRRTDAKLRADLEATNQKYRESLREVEDLNTQMSEAKLNGDMSITPRPEAGDEDIEVLAGSEDLRPRTPMRTNNARRTSMRRPESLLIETTNRQSPNAKLARRSSGSFLGYNKSDGSRSSSPQYRARSMSQSLSQELLAGAQQAQKASGGPRPLSLTGSVPPSPVLKAFEPDSPANYERKVASLEKETMRLQEALKERDDEIRALEETLRQNTNGAVPTFVGVHTPSSPSPLRPIDLEDASMLSPTPLGSRRQSLQAASLTPVTEKEFMAIRQLIAETKLENGDSSEENVTRLDELMRSMARKETTHREKVESLTEELIDVKKQNETLQALSRDQIANMSSEIEGLREQLREAQASKPPPASTQDDVTNKRELERQAHGSAVADLREDSQAKLAALKNEHAQTMAAALTTRDLEHEEAMARASKSHAEALERKAAEALSNSQRKADEHKQAMVLAQEKHERELKLLVEEHAESIRNAETARASAVSESDEERAGLLSKLQSDHQTQVSRIKEEHEITLARALEAKDAGHRSAIAEHEASLASREAEHASVLASELEKAQRSHSHAVEELKSQLESEHMSSLTEAIREAEAKAQDERNKAVELIKQEHAAQIQELRQANDAALSVVEERSAKLAQDHAIELDNLTREHAGISSRSQSSYMELEAKHADLERQLESVHRDHERAIAQLEGSHISVLNVLRGELEQANKGSEEIRAAHAELEAKHRAYVEQLEFDPHEVDQLRAELAETSDALVTLENALTEAQYERDQLARELESFRPGGATSLGRSIPDPALTRELENQRDLVSQARQDLSKLKSELQLANEERSRQEQLIRDLQAKLASSETRSIKSQDSGNFTESNESSVTGARSSIPKRSSDYEPFVEPRASRSLGSTNSIHGKPPPPTPPPNMPPPPLPAGANGGGPVTPLARQSGGVRSSTSSAVTRPESPAGGLTRSSSATSVHSPSISSIMQNDPKTAKLLVDQAEEIKNLAKQLNHCEADLQANIDLVATLEAALNDSERNLRKSRVQLTEVARERDRYASQADEMRAQLNSAQNEVESVRNSVMLEKQGYETKIEEERQAKEKARQALEARLEEVARRKNSKLFCL